MSSSSSSPAITLPTLFKYNTNDEIVFPASFQTIEEVKTFVDVLNLRGYSYSQKNTSKGKGQGVCRGISYKCNRCGSTMSFTFKGDKFCLTKKSAHEPCNCERVGRQGNTLQRFPKGMCLVAIVALLESGINIPETENRTIIDVLRREWDFRVAGDDLVKRIREEYNPNMTLSTTAPAPVPKLPEPEPLYTSVPECVPWPNQCLFNPFCLDQRQCYQPQLPVQPLFTDNQLYQTYTTNGYFVQPEYFNYPGYGGAQQVQRYIDCNSNMGCTAYIF